jgi:hypothetical protein
MPTTPVKRAIKKTAIGCAALCPNWCSSSGFFKETLTLYIITADETISVNELIASEITAMEFETIPTAILIMNKKMLIISDR